MTSGPKAGTTRRTETEAEIAVRQALMESHRRLLAFLKRRLGSTDEAEEVLQDFMLRALDRAGDLRQVPTVRGWLSRVLASTIADHQRRAARRRSRTTPIGPEQVETIPSEPDAALDAAVCDCLESLLPTLKPEYADVIRRIDLREEPRAMVAESLGLAVNALTVRLHRARQMLRKRLLEMCLTCPVHGFLDCGCDAAERARRGREAAFRPADL